jgi:hypothetical protein
VEIPYASRGDAKHHSLRAESSAGSIYTRIDIKHAFISLDHDDSNSYNENEINETASFISKQSCEEKILQDSLPILSVPV